MIDKVELLKKFQAQLEEDLKAAIAAAVATYEAATHEESKPENEYDTRGLEASYLAGAQAKRAGQIEELIAICKSVRPRPFHDEDRIAATAIVHLEIDGTQRTCFILPKAGGHVCEVGGVAVQIISPQSPLGSALIGQRVGDVVTVEIGSTTREYEVLDLE